MEEPLKQEILDLITRTTDPLTEITSGPEVLRIGILCNLCAEALLALDDLSYAVKELRITTAAYHARNLLELVVWTRYCLVSRENAKRIQKDAERDKNGLLELSRLCAELFRVFGEKPGSKTIKQIEMLDQTGKLDTKFLPVVEAAESLGHQDLILFKFFNKYLSKFTHPTALVIVGGFSEESAKAQGANFLKIGKALLKLMLADIGIKTPELLNSKP